MRNKAATKNYYLDNLGFRELGRNEFDNYLILEKDSIELHFFAFSELVPADNYGQVYIRTNDIDGIYQRLLAKKISIHPNGKLQLKPWGQREFSLLDPDNNLLTFGQSTAG